MCEIFKIGCINFQFSTPGYLEMQIYDDNIKRIDINY